MVYTIPNIFMNEIEELERHLLDLGFECLSVPDSSKRVYVKGNLSLFVTRFTKDNI